MSLSLVTKDFFEGKGLYWTEGLQEVHVEAFLVAQKAVNVFPVIDPLLLERLHVIEGESLDLLKNSLVPVFA